MKKIFYSGTYRVQHRLITEENVKDMLKDDLRSKLVDKIDDVIYASEGVITKNPNVTYVGGFYYEKGEGTTITEKVVNAELSQIERADFVIVNLLGHAAIGSLAEIMYAASINKPMVIFVKNDDKLFDVTGEYWFPLLTLSKMNVEYILKKVDSEQEIIDYIMNL
jgi:hypothetical protein